MSKTLIFVRHGETRSNREGIAQGWSDSPLSQDGLRQIQEAAGRIRAEQPTSLYTSTLPRAVETACAIANATGLTPVPLEDLREMNCGRWEGLPFLEIRQDEPDFFRRWMSDPELPCPDGESLAEVHARMGRAIRLIEDREGDRGEESRTVIVSHGTSIRLAAALLLGTGLGMVQQLAQDNAAINRFERRGTYWILQTWNDISHRRGVEAEDTR